MSSITHAPDSVCRSVIALLFGKRVNLIHVSRHSLLKNIFQVELYIPLCLSPNLFFSNHKFGRLALSEVGVYTYLFP